MDRQEIIHNPEEYIYEGVATELPPNNPEQTVTPFGVPIEAESVTNRRWDAIKKHAGHVVASAALVSAPIAAEAQPAAAQVLHFDHRYPRIAVFQPATIPKHCNGQNFYLCVDYSDYGNFSQAPNCTVAAAGNDVEFYDARQGTTSTLTTKEAISIYNTMEDPSSPYFDIYDYWERNGLGGNYISTAHLYGHDIADIRAALNKYGVIDATLEFKRHVKFDDPNGPIPINKTGPKNAHEIAVIGYNHGGVFFVSWGGKYHMSWKQAQAYFINSIVAVDETTNAPSQTAASGNIFSYAPA